MIQGKGVDNKDQMKYIMLLPDMIQSMMQEL